jgi:large subunit ribosomal protein L21e
MPHSFGYRGGTRTLFKKAFRTNGRCNSTTYLRTFKRGDYVDLKVDSSIHKGMPHKYYHGRTGVIFNVNKRAVGVSIKKTVNGRVIKKNIHVAIPHVHKSKCQDEMLRRVKENEAAKIEVRKGGAKQNLKRVNALPKVSHFYTPVDMTTIRATPYIDLV